MKKVIEASEAVAIGAKLCDPAVIPMYPITPQTHIVEKLADFVNDGLLKSEVIHAESEHSALSACIGAAAMGKRTFTATASQGLALMNEILFIVSGMRLPVVMAVANRALSAPINIWNDHQDSISSRDSGWIQLYVESAQEALDTVIMAYKIAENSKVMLPVMVCLDGFTLSHVHEPVDIPEKKDVDSFLPKLKMQHILDVKSPKTFGPIGYPNTFMKFRKQQQDAMDAALSIITKANSDFKKQFKRGYGNGLVETYKADEAETLIVVSGTVAGTSRVLIDELRQKKHGIGLLKIKCLRPFPHGDLKKAAKKAKRFIIIDRSNSPGQEPALYTEISSCLSNEKKKPVLHSFVMGLGGKDVKKQDLLDIFRLSLKSKSPLKQWVL